MSAMTQMLVEKRETIWNEAKAILDRADAGKRGLSPIEEKRYEVLTAQLADLRDNIESRKAEDATNAQAQSALRALGSQPVDPRSGFSGGTEKRWLPSLAEFRELQVEQRAVGTSGAFIPVDYSNRWFDQIRTRVGVLDAGPTILPVEHAGSVKVPLVNASVTVAGVAEGGTITASDPGLSNITLDPKKFAAYTVVDREAVEDSNPALMTIVENSLIKDFAVKLDQEFVAGDGTGQNLLGLLGISGFTAGPSTGANGTSLTGSAGLDFLFDTVGAYEAANNDPDKAAWLMNSRTFASIRKLKDSQGRPIINVDMAAGAPKTLCGHRVFITNNISSTLTVGTSTDTSSLLLVDFSQIVVAVSRQVELMMSTDVAFQSDQVALRVTGRFDIGAPQPTAIVKTVGLRP